MIAPRSTWYLAKPCSFTAPFWQVHGWQMSPNVTGRHCAGVSQDFSNFAASSTVEPQPTAATAASKGRTLMAAQHVAE